MGKRDARSEDLLGPILVDDKQIARVAAGNPVLRRVLRWRVPAIPALVFLFGPVVMWSTYLLYVRSAWPEATGPRALTYFLSATWGDALLLPAIALLIALAYRDFADARAEFPHAWWMLWGPIGWAVLSTSVLTLGWLSSADNVNWAQPAGGGWLGLPLHLNLAGWVHTGFFILMQWWLAEFSLRLIVVLVRLASRTESFKAKAAKPLLRLTVKANGILILGIAFGLLLLKDYWPQVQALPLRQTWTWFLSPVGSLVFAGCIDAVVIAWLRRREALTESVRAELWVLAAIWLVSAVVVVSLAAIQTVWQPLLTEVGWMVLAPIALALLGAVNVWAEIYWFQRRQADPLGWAVIVACGLVLLAGFCVSLLMAASGPSAAHVRAMGWPWLAALGVDVLGCALAIGLALGLARRESTDQDYLDMLAKNNCKRCLGEETPEHDIVQNISQYGMLHALLPMFVVSYELIAWPIVQSLDQSAHISPLFGYSGVVATAVAFPLYNNMSHVRGLEEESKQRKAGKRPRLSTGDFDEYLSADKNFTTFQTVAVGFIAALVAISLWVNVIDQIVGKTR